MEEDCNRPYTAIHQDPPGGSPPRPTGVHGPSPTPGHQHAHVVGDEAQARRKISPRPEEPGRFSPATSPTPRSPSYPPTGKLHGLTADGGLLSHWWPLPLLALRRETRWSLGRPLKDPVSESSRRKQYCHGQDVEENRGRWRRANTPRDPPTAGCFTAPARVLCDGGPECWPP